MRWVWLTIGSRHIKSRLRDGWCLTTHMCCVPASIRYTWIWSGNKILGGDTSGTAWGDAGAGCWERKFFKADTGLGCVEGAACRSYVWWFSGVIVWLMKGQMLLHLLKNWLWLGSRSVRGTLVTSEGSRGETQSRIQSRWMLATRLHRARFCSFLAAFCSILYPLQFLNFPRAKSST